MGRRGGWIRAGAEEGVQELQESDQLPVVSVSRQLKRSKGFIESGFAAKFTSARSFYRSTLLDPPCPPCEPSPYRNKPASLSRLKDIARRVDQSGG